MIFTVDAERTGRKHSVRKSISSKVRGNSGGLRTLKLSC
jgi:hypothetical protein